MYTRRVKNTEFAKRVGCHFTSASRYRNGNRLPGVPILGRIMLAFGLPLQSTLDAYDKGAEEFSRYLREHVFDPQEEAA